MARPRKYKSDADRQRAGRIRRRAEAATPGEFVRVSESAGTVHVRQIDEPAPPPALLDARTQRARNGRDRDPLAEYGHVAGSSGSDVGARKPRRRHHDLEARDRDYADAFPISTDPDAEYGRGASVLVPVEIALPGSGLIMEGMYAADYASDPTALANVRRTVWNRFRADAARGSDHAALTGEAWRSWVASLDPDSDHDLVAWRAAMAVRATP